MRMYFFIVVMFVMCVPLSGAAQAISLEEFLSTVEQNHPYFEQESLSVNISIESQKRFLGEKDWIVESSPFISYENRTCLFSNDI
jgi:hypothetical protein